MEILEGEKMIDEKSKSSANDISDIMKYMTSLIFNQIPIPINFVDANCNVIVMNQAFLDYLGLNLKDVQGKHLTEIDPMVRLPIVLKTGKAEIAQKHCFKDGRKAICHRIPLFYENKIIGGVGIILIDDLNYIYNLSRENFLLNNLNHCKPSTAADMYKAKYKFEDIFTVSESGKKAIQIAKNYSKNDFTVLIIGESGVGKELFAHSIHNESKRKDAPFVSVNCAAIPENLIESEFFGYDNGAFTGANKQGKIGKFEFANGGTIFLDEIGDLPLSMQSKLLRVLQENELIRVGSNQIIRLDLKVIAATNCNLEEKIKQGQFREDLYYRLNVLNLNVPPLRERKEDIPLLIDNFITKLYQKFGIYKKFSDVAINILTNYYWPGNIRELKNIVERIAVNTSTNTVKEDNIPEYIIKSNLSYKIKESEKKILVNNVGLKNILEDIEKTIIEDTLKALNGNKAQTANKLGIPKMTLYRKLKKFKDIKNINN